MKLYLNKKLSEQADLPPFLLFLSCMPRKNKLANIIILTVLAVSIHLFSSSPARVEKLYATQLYPGISTFLKFLFGWLPFSIGDILYGFFTGWFLWTLFKVAVVFSKEEFAKEKISQVLYKGIYLAMMVYIIFNFMWGINYNRIGIVNQFDITLEKYSATQLKNIDSLLLLKVNETRIGAVRQGNFENLNNPIFKGATAAYSEAEKNYPFLAYNSISLKKSMWGWLGNYLGFTGYYNPFTGESQVNTTIPLFLQPFTTCHEVAHQFGYAKENEANFVGYLAAVSSKDTFFHYSAYLDLFIYANRDLYNLDSNAAKYFSKKLLPEVKSDLEEWKNFSRRHKNPVEPAIHWLYGKYLQGNQQPSGVFSYDEVTGLLIAYYKKFGKI